MTPVNVKCDLEIKDKPMTFNAMLKSPLFGFAVKYNDKFYLAQSVCIDYEKRCLKAQDNDGTIIAFIDHVYYDKFKIYEIKKYIGGGFESEC